MDSEPLRIPTLDPDITIINKELEFAVLVSEGKVINHLVFESVLEFRLILEILYNTPENF